MKQARLRKAAAQDFIDETRFYRREAGVAVARKLRAALQDALDQIERSPGIGSPAVGLELGVLGLRAWRLTNFPVSVWYLERVDHIDVVRLIGQRQDSRSVDIDRH